jgi:hypothetical protein
MRGRIESGQLVTLAPVDPADVEEGDCSSSGGATTCCTWSKKSARSVPDRNLGKADGWVAASAVRGKVIAVDNALS